MDERCNIHISQNIAHYRSLELAWKTGQSTRIRLDQGVGYWRGNGGNSFFDNQANATEQAAEMMQQGKGLEVGNGKDFATLVFIKERDG